MPAGQTHNILAEPAGINLNSGGTIFNFFYNGLKTGLLTRIKYMLPDKFIHDEVFCVV